MIYDHLSTTVRTGADFSRQILYKFDRPILESEMAQPPAAKKNALTDLRLQDACPCYGKEASMNINYPLPPSRTAPRRRTKSLL